METSEAVEVAEVAHPARCYEVAEDDAGGHDPKAKKPSRLCRLCGRRLQSIGTARANGTRRHNDWTNRDLHKRCWKSLQPKRQPKHKGHWRSLQKRRRRF